MRWSSGDYQIAPIAARSTAMGRWRLMPPGYGGRRLRARDGTFRASARVTFFFCKKKVTKENHSNLRFKDPLARGGQVQIWRCVLAGGVQRSSLSVKRTVPAFTGAEADAAACFSHGRRFSLLPPHPKSLPLEGFAVLNDTPVACQTRGPTDPQGDRWRAAPDEGSLVPTAAAKLPPREFICCTPSRAAL